MAAEKLRQWEAAKARQWNEEYARLLANQPAVVGVQQQYHLSPNISLGDADDADDECVGQTSVGPVQRSSPAQVMNAGAAGPSRCLRCSFILNTDNILSHTKKCSDNKFRIEANYISDRSLCGSGRNCEVLDEEHFFEYLH